MERYPAWEDTKERYPAMTETRERDGKALSHSGKRQIQENCIRQCRRRGMLLRANAEKRYPAWEDTKGMYPAMTEMRERDGKALSYSGKRKIRKEGLRQCRK